MTPVYETLHCALRTTLHEKIDHIDHKALIELMKAVSSINGSTVPIAEQIYVQLRLNIEEL